MSYQTYARPRSNVRNHVSIQLRYVHIDVVFFKHAICDRLFSEEFRKPDWREQLQTLREIFSRNFIIT